MEQWEAVGKAAYDAYFESAGGVSLVNGEVLPTWEEADDKIKAAWISAAKAAVIYFDEKYV